MTSIDEAIAHTREVAAIQRNNDKLNKTLGVISPYYKADCIKCAEEHEQLAEWLELLKWYEQGMEDIPSESGVLPKDVYHAGYNKALDDFVKLVHKHDWNIRDRNENTFIYGAVDTLAEQLKVGVIE